MPGFGPAPGGGGAPGLPSHDVGGMMEEFAKQQAAGGGAAGQNPAIPGTSNIPSVSSANPQAPKQQRTPRPVGTLPQEMKYFAGDVAQGLLSLLPDFMQSMFGIKPTDTPEDAARKKQMLQRYQQMNADQQQYVQQKVREEQQKKQQEEEEKAQRKQMDEQQAASELPMPQGKTRGEGGPGASQKKRTVTKLQNDRKKLSSAG